MRFANNFPVIFTGYFTLILFFIIRPTENILGHILYTYIFLFFLISKNWKLQLKNFQEIYNIGTQFRDQEYTQDAAGIKIGDNSLRKRKDFLAELKRQRRTLRFMLTPLVITASYYLGTYLLFPALLPKMVISIGVIAIILILTSKTKIWGMYVFLLYIGLFLIIYHTDLTKQVDVMVLAIGTSVFFLLHKLLSDSFWIHSALSKPKASISQTLKSILPTLVIFTFVFILSDTLISEKPIINKWKIISKLLQRFEPSAPPPIPDEGVKALQEKLSLARSALPDKIDLKLDAKYIDDLLQQIKLNEELISHLSKSQLNYGSQLGQQGRGRINDNLSQLKLDRTEYELKLKNGTQFLNDQDFKSLKDFHASTDFSQFKNSQADLKNLYQRQLAKGKIPQSKKQITIDIGKLKFNNKLNLKQVEKLKQVMAQKKEQIAEKKREHNELKKQLAAAKLNEIKSKKKLKNKKKNRINRILKFISLSLLVLFLIYLRNRLKRTVEPEDQINLSEGDKLFLKEEIKQIPKTFKSYPEEVKYKYRLFHHLVETIYYPQKKAPPVGILGKDPEHLLPMRTQAIASLLGKQFNLIIFEEKAKFDSSEKKIFRKSFSKFIKALKRL